MANPAAPASDFRDYFNTRLTQEIAANEQRGVSTKFDELQRASAEKQESLGRLILDQEKALKLNENSNVALLGLDPKSFSGRLTNASAMMGEGLVREVQQQASGYHTSDAEVMKAGVPDEAFAAWQRTTKQGGGQPTPEDLRLLDTPVQEPTAPGMVPPEAGTEQISNAPGADAMLRTQAKQALLNPLTGRPETYFDRIQKINAAEAKSVQIRQGMDQSSLVHRGSQKEMADLVGEGYREGTGQIGEGWGKVTSGKDLTGGAKDLAAGLSKLIETVGEAGLENPQATAEHLIGNVPGMMMAAAGAGKGMLVSNTAYALEEYGKGIAAWKAAHNGEQPPAAERAKMAATAASLGVAESVGERLGLNLGKVGTGITKGIAKAAGETAEDAATKGFKDTLRNAAKTLSDNPITRTLGAGVAAGAGEFATEGYQTFAEGLIQGKPIDGEEIFLGATIGALSGGGMSGGMRGAAELTGATPQAGAKRAATAATQQTKSLAQLNAIASGDVSTLLDQTNRTTYSPSGAVAALQGNAELPETTAETP